MRRFAYAVSAILVVWASLSVPMPRVELAPGAAPPIAPLVEIDTEQPITEIHGALHLLTVNVGSPSLVEVVRTAFDDRRQLEERSNVIPEGIDPGVFFEQQRQAFVLSFDVAAAVGARLAGFEIDVRTAPVLANVIEGSPADGVLEPGDTILAIDGTEVSSGEELASLTAEYVLGDEVDLRVLRGAEELELSVTIGQVDAMTRPGLGVFLQGDRLLEVETPFDIDLGPTRIGGPSAGMMIALTVYDLLSDEDLARGRIIAGTGTITLSGQVGSISGIPQKVAAAESVRAELMLVPEPLLELALASRRTAMEIVGVATIEDALEALRR